MSLTEKRKEGEREEVVGREREREGEKEKGSEGGKDVVTVVRASLLSAYCQSAQLMALEGVH